MNPFVAPQLSSPSGSSGPSTIITASQNNTRRAQSPAPESQKRQKLTENKPGQPSPYYKSIGREYPYQKALQASNRASLTSASLTSKRTQSSGSIKSVAAFIKRSLKAIRKLSNILHSITNLGTKGKGEQRISDADLKTALKQIDKHGGSLTNPNNPRFNDVEDWLETGHFAEATNALPQENSIIPPSQDQEKEELDAFKKTFKDHLNNYLEMVKIIKTQLLAEKERLDRLPENAPANKSVSRLLADAEVINNSLHLLPNNQEKLEQGATIIEVDELNGNDYCHIDPDSIIAEYPNYNHDLQSAKSYLTVQSQLNNLNDLEARVDILLKQIDRIKSTSSLDEQEKKIQIMMLDRLMTGAKELLLRPEN